MRYKLAITLHAEELLENIIEYIAVRLKNKGAAAAVLADVDEAYNNLEEMAETFPYCEDPQLAARGFRKIILKRHEYVILYKESGDVVTVEGIFHELENYGSKL